MLDASDTIQVIGFDPTDTKAVYLGTSKTLLKSVDSGNTYQASATGLPVPVEVRHFAIEGPLVWVSTNQGIFQSLDSGAHFVLSLSSGATGILIAPGNTNEVYTITDAARIFRTLDGGKTWNVFEQGLPSGTTVQSMTFDAGQRLYALGTAGLGLFRTDPTRTTFSLVSNVQLPAIDVFLADPNRPDELYGLNAFGSMVRSLNAGVNWTDESDGIVGSVVLDGVASRRFFFTVTNDGLYRAPLP
jgi:photosystem II stability/assembly factor-like uncharacterized protein